MQHVSRRRHERTHRYFYSTGLRRYLFLLKHNNDQKDSSRQMDGYLLVRLVFISLNLFVVLSFVFA
jgi:hypothetical protein